MQTFYRWYTQLLRSPKYRWWIIIGTLVYLFSPIDISPDIFPLAGQIDDIALVTLLFTALWQEFTDFLQSRRQDSVAEPDSTTDASQESTKKVKTIDVEATQVE